MRFKKVLFMGVLSLSLLLTLTTVAVAEEKATTTKSQTQPSVNSIDHSSMDMEKEMKNTEEHGSSSTSGGDAKGGHGEESTESTGSEGVSWPVVGGFLGINLLVVLIAGALKFMNKSKNPISAVGE